MIAEGTGRHFRRYYPPDPFTPRTAYLYAAWRACLIRARRNERYEGEADQPTTLNEGTAWAEPLTVELALAWAERWAAEELTR